MGLVICPEMAPAAVLTNCGIAAALTTLQFKRVPVPHLTLGDDNGCFYMRSGRIGYIAASYRFTVAEQLARYGISQEQYHSDLPDEVWEAIVANISQMNPVMFYCNTTYLPYFPTYNTPHLTVVKGYDSETRQIYLCDAVGTGPDNISWEEFVQAISLPPAMARLVGAHRRFKWETIDSSKAIPVTPNILREHLRENQALLRGEVPLDQTQRARLLALWEMPADCVVVSGWEALDVYAEEVPELLAGADTPTVYRTHWMVWDFWQQRRIMYETLRYLAEREGRLDLAEAAERLNNAIKSWTVIRGLVMKHELRPSPQNLEALSRRLRQVRTEEMRAIADLAV